MKSILHKKDGTCYLCEKLYRMNYTYRYTEEHHVFGGTANRRLSERYGLKVYLCVFHHREGPEAVQNNSYNDNLLKMDAQEAFEKTHTREEFMGIFGRNWLDEDPMEEGFAACEESREEARRAAGHGTEEKEQDAAGFQILEEEDALDGMGSRYLEIEKAAAARELNDRQFKNLLEIAQILY